MLKLYGNDRTMGGHGIGQPREIMPNTRAIKTNLERMASAVFTVDNSLSEGNRGNSAYGLALIVGDGVIGEFTVKRYVRMTCRGWEYSVVEYGIAYNDRLEEIRIIFVTHFRPPVLFVGSTCALCPKPSWTHFVYLQCVIVCTYITTQIQQLE